MSTRDKILDAAAEVIADRGLAHATTKEIARAAGFSEAMLYKHFDAKTDLFLAVLTERSHGDLAAALRRLRERPSGDSFTPALETVAVAAVSYYRQSVPTAAALFAEPDLLDAHRRQLVAHDAGPQLALEALSQYLTQCRQRGEIAPKADPDAAAALLLGACFQRAFMSHFGGPDDDEITVRQFAASVVATLTVGLR